MFLFILQPVFGLLHHKHYRRSLSLNHNTSQWRLFLHIWYGRILIILGIINGGLGLQLAANWSVAQMLAYVIVVAVVALLYGGVLLLWYTGTLDREKGEISEGIEQENGTELGIGIGEGKRTTR